VTSDELCCLGVSKPGAIPGDILVGGAFPETCPGMTGDGDDPSRRGGTQARFDACAGAALDEGGVDETFAKT